jgi:hypothetical protein
MRYVMLIYGVESHYTRMSPSEMGTLMGEWNAFHEGLIATGKVEL